MSMAQVSSRQVNAYECPDATKRARAKLPPNAKGAVSSWPARGQCGNNAGKEGHACQVLLSLPP